MNDQDPNQQPAAIPPLADTSGSAREMNTLKALVEHYRKSNETQGRIRYELYDENQRLRAALVKIRDIDYSGNRHESHYIAQLALTPNTEVSDGA